MRNAIMVAGTEHYFTVSVITGEDSFGVRIWSRDDANRLIAMIMTERDKLPEQTPKKAAKAKNA